MGIRISKYIGYLWDSVLDVIYGNDEKCITCGGFAQDGGLCISCREKLYMDSIELMIQREGIKLPVYCCCYYRIVVKELIIRLKYKSDFRSGEILVNLMKEYLDDLSLPFDIFTFVPASEEAYDKRGYNQSEFLCKKLSDIKDKKMVDCLILKKHKADQIGLDGDERWNNLRDIFEVKKQEDIKNKNVLLIDDVITTGATTFYCAKALMESGVKSVMVLTVAKSTI